MKDDNITGKYILDTDGKTPIECPDLMEWGHWFEERGREGRRVALTQINDDCKVSTVFLGLDHSWSDEGPPILFETMVFSNDEMDGEMERYATWEEAEAGHQAMVDRVNRGSVHG